MADQRPRTKAALAPGGIERRGNACGPEIRRPIELRPEHEQRPERPQQSSRDGVRIGHRAVIPGAGKSFAYAAREKCSGRRGNVRPTVELQAQLPNRVLLLYGTGCAGTGGGKEGLKVRCPNCAVEVNPLREYCHSCGSPTDPDVRERLRARAGGRSPEELKSNRKTVLIACAAIAAALAIGGRLSFPGIPIHIGTHSARKGPILTDA